MICSMKELLWEAEKENRAVGAFSVYNMETVKGVIEGAEEMNAPIILQIAEARFQYAPFHLMAPMMLQAAKESKVKVAVHLDHGKHLETLKRALEAGFTSVMLDASEQSLNDNIQMTKEAVKMASHYGAAVEAELGCVGGNEGMGDIKNSCTNSDEARQFVKETKVDALAIAIGNAHGNYKQKPRLQFEVLEKIHKENHLPLVLHGGSGISFPDFRKTINNGIRKINIATANLEALSFGAKEALSEQNSDYFQISRNMVDRVRECTKLHIYVFNNRGSLENIGR